MPDASAHSAMPSLPAGPETLPPLDVGDRGCGDGIAQDLRRHIDAVAVGEHVRVTVRDPSAKADVPSVTRMLGHRVVSEEPQPDGRLVMILERGK